MDLGDLLGAEIHELLFPTMFTLESPISPQKSQDWEGLIVICVLMCLCRVLRSGGIRWGWGEVEVVFIKVLKLKVMPWSLFISSFTSAPNLYPTITKKNITLWGILYQVSFPAFFIWIILINPLYLNLNMSFPESLAWILAYFSLFLDIYSPRAPRAPCTFSVIRFIILLLLPVSC